MNTSNLTTGYLYMLWMVTINDPEVCNDSPRTSKGVQKRTSAPLSIADESLT